MGTRTVALTRDAVRQSAFWQSTPSLRPLLMEIGTSMAWTTKSHCGTDFGQNATCFLRELRFVGPRPCGSRSASPTSRKLCMMLRHLYGKDATAFDAVLVKKSTQNVLWTWGKTPRLD